MKKKCTLLFSCLALAGILSSQSLVHYWNFNDSTDINTLLAPGFSLLGGAGIHYVSGPGSALSGDDGSGFDVTNPNARNGDESLTHLRLNNPIGSELLVDLPTTGFDQVVVKYAARRSGSGAGRQTIFYSTDGMVFDSLLSLEPVNDNPILHMLDFSAIHASHDNPNFRIRITFEQGQGGTSGNNRFDNLTLEGTPIGMDVFPPTVTFFPTDGSVNIPPDVLPTLGFNESVRLLSGDPIANEDVPYLIHLSKDSISGDAVPFTGDMTGNTLTVMPSALLENGATYFLTLWPNTVADLAGNALTDSATVSFSILSAQTVFQPGDIVPVAYRMNANGADDEIALLTFVNISPGTLLNLTDAKYTDNPQPQCPGGLTWTSPNQIIPAGSVFSVQTSAGLASSGSVAGSTFGLSSGGDQVIIYTGSPAAPAYVTALSSNAWTSPPFTNGSGSFSLLPAGLAADTSAIHLGTAPGSTAGNAPNAYYAGPQAGSREFLRLSVLNPDNWIVAGSGTLPQAWPSWNFPGPPQVTEAAVLSATAIRLVFNSDLDSTSAENQNNYSGIGGLVSISATTNGPLPDTVLLTFDQPFVQGNAYSLVVADVLDTDGRSMLEPFFFDFEYVTKVSFSDRFQSVSEADGTVTIRLTVENPSPGSSVELVL